MSDNKKRIEIRCKECNKLFAYVTMFEGEITCSRCKKINRYKIYSQETLDKLFITKEIK